MTTKLVIDLVFLLLWPIALFWAICEDIIRGSVYGEDGA